MLHRAFLFLWRYTSHRGDVAYVDPVTGIPAAVTLRTLAMSVLHDLSFMPKFTADQHEAEIAVWLATQLSGIQVSDDFLDDTMLSRQETSCFRSFIDGCSTIDFDCPNLAEVLEEEAGYRSISGRHGTLLATAIRLSRHRGFRGARV